MIDLDGDENAKAIRDSIFTIAGATISMISTIAFTSGYVSVPVSLTSLYFIIKAAWDWKVNSDQMLVSQDDDFMEVQIGRSTLLSKKYACPKLEWEDASRDIKLELKKYPKEKADWVDVDYYYNKPIDNSMVVGVADCLTFS